VNSHKNARTTYLGRVTLIKRVLIEGETPKEVATSLGVSTRTVYKWIRRFREEGEKGLKDRSSAPHQVPRKISEKYQEYIRCLRQQRLTGRLIAERLRLARSTVARILKYLGMNRLSRLSEKSRVRYEHRAAGELLHVDIKKLARFSCPGHRVTGIRRKDSFQIGWEFVHVAIDDHSRLAYVEVLPDESKESAVFFLQRAVGWFKSIGIRIKRILSDNGSCYVSKLFSLICKQLRLKHSFTRPYRPQTNGKAERFIQTLLREWAYAKPYASSAYRLRALAPWIRHYNFH